MILGRYLQQRRESSRVRLDAVSYLLGDVLVDKQNGNVLALLGELVEGSLDSRVFGLGIDDEEVLLAVWRLGDVLRQKLDMGCKRLEVLGKSYAYACEEHARYCILRSISAVVAGMWGCAPHRQ